MRLLLQEERQGSVHHHENETICQTLGALPKNTLLTMVAYYLTRRSRDTWYVAREYKYKGQDACTITWNVKNAKRFESEAEADACNDRLLVSGWISEPFDKTKAK